MAFTFKPLSLRPFTRAQKQRLIDLADDPAKTYVFPFNLSQRPPAKWAQLFQVVWYQHYGGAAIPRLDGETVLVSSTPNDLRIALSSLRLVVDSTNEKYLDGERRRSEAEAGAAKSREEAKREAQKSMSDALEDLRF